MSNLNSQILDSIRESDFVLVGIGEEFENKDCVEEYNKLADILEGKNYYVISLCKNDSILDSKLNMDRVIKPLGGYSMRQCPDACTDELYDKTVFSCPHCGKSLVFNNIECENYVEAGYLPKWDEYKKWLTFTLKKKFVILELGVNLTFPQVIRWPFEKLAMINYVARLIRINEKFWQIPVELKDSADCIQQNSVQWLAELR